MTSTTHHRTLSWAKEAEYTFKFRKLVLGT
jgi:hypothetical protein